MKFTLEIKLGNDAMQLNEDIAAALHDVAYYVEQHDNSHGIIHDANGNNVGRWGFQND